MSDDYKYLCKIVLIGSSGVGKTSLIKQYTDNAFDNTYISTIGVDFKIKNITVNNEIVKLQIWDTAGQERFRTITRSYYRGAHGIIIVFDVNDVESFHSIQGWILEVKENSHENVVISVIGNKDDLEQKVKESDVKNLLDKMDIKYDYQTTSAKMNHDVDELFSKMATNMVEMIKKDKLVFPEKNREKFVGLDDNKKFGCC